MRHEKQMFAHMTRHWDGGIEYFLASSDMSNMGYTPVCDVMVEFETPDDFNPVAAEIASLKVEKQRIQAEAQQKANEIDDRIAKISCIEYRP